MMIINRLNQDNDGEDFVHPKFFPLMMKMKDRREEDKNKRVSLDMRLNEEDEINELYKDVNVNLERRDTKMTDVNVQTTQVIKDTYVIITAATLKVQQQSSSVSSGFISNMLNPNSDKGIDSILNLNNESTSLVDVLVTTNVEVPPSSVTTFPPPPIPHIEPQQQTPVSTPTIVPIVSSIPGIVDTYLANKMNEVIKTVVQLQSDRLRSEAQVDNEDFINKIDENMKKIIKEQVKTSYVVAANLSELELKKILIDKMENNKSIDRLVPQKNLYKALVDVYESDKDILPSYGDTVTLKRHRDDEDEDEEPSSTGKSAQVEEPIHTDEDLEEPAHQEFDTGFTEDQPVDETTQHPDPRESFNELMDTPLDFSASMLNRLKVDTLTPELLAGPTFELMKVNTESAYDVYSRHKILAVTKLKIVEWHNYKHLEWITVRKLTNLNIEERLALGVSQRMFTRSIVLKRCVKDLQLGVKSYQKKLNLTRPDTYRSDLNQKSAYKAYSNPKGFIYQNKDKKNKMMCIDELHKFSDGTLNDVRSALNDILKRVRMKYLPQIVWRNVDRETARPMIQAID
ncbi:hypothetical protein Tco_0303838 [Tanacetum coccineum]